jgi:hypothetical protein
MAAQWEYKVVTFKFHLKGFDYGQIELDLNDFGRQGWEAISTIAPSIGQGQVMEVAVLLKRASA